MVIFESSISLSFIDIKLINKSSIKKSRSLERQKVICILTLTINNTVPHQNSMRILSYLKQLIGLK